MLLLSLFFFRFKENIQRCNYSGKCYALRWQLTRKDNHFLAKERPFIPTLCASNVTTHQVIARVGVLFFFIVTWLVDIIQSEFQLAFNKNCFSSPALWKDLIHSIEYRVLLKCCIWKQQWSFSESIKGANWRLLRVENFALLATCLFVPLNEQFFFLRIFFVSCCGSGPFSW